MSGVKGNMEIGEVVKQAIDSIFEANHKGINCLFVHLCWNPIECSVVMALEEIGCQLKCGRKFFYGSNLSSSPSESPAHQISMCS
ncbi:hypothetical protein PIB30_013546 [Stylosanthes scabra]|uniref:Uncharacterized protein n=1 Tax=Stylosanthes scabra TaxID=79078 RepID=A0ABU6R6X6_9FABA|nr:hypothetical protein [Stylosanthes scabra]